MAGVAQNSAGRTASAASNPRAPDTQGGLLRLGKCSFVSALSKGETRGFSSIPLFSVEQFWIAKGHQTQPDNDPCGDLKQLSPTQRLLVLLEIPVRSL